MLNSNDFFFYEHLFHNQIRLLEILSQIKEINLEETIFKIKRIINISEEQNEEIIISLIFSVTYKSQYDIHLKKRIFLIYKLFNILDQKLKQKIGKLIMNSIKHKYYALQMLSSEFLSPKEIYDIMFTRYEKEIASKNKLISEPLIYKFIYFYNELHDFYFNQHISAYYINLPNYSDDRNNLYKHNEKKIIQMNEKLGKSNASNLIIDQNMLNYIVKADEINEFKNDLNIFDFSLVFGLRNITLYLSHNQQLISYSVKTKTFILLLADPEIISLFESCFIPQDYLIALWYSLKYHNERFEWIYEKVFNHIGEKEKINYLIAAIQFQYFEGIDKFLNDIKEIDLNSQIYTYQNVIIDNCIITHYLYYFDNIKRLNVTFVKRFEYYFGAVEINQFFNDLIRTYRSKYTSSCEKRVIFQSILKTLKNQKYEITNEKLKSYIDNVSITLSVDQKGSNKKIYASSNIEFENVDGFYIETINPYDLTKRCQVRTCEQYFLSLQQIIIFISQLPKSYSLKKIKNSEGVISAHIKCSTCNHKHFKLRFDDTMSTFEIFYYKKCDLLVWKFICKVRSCSKKCKFELVKPKDSFDFQLKNFVEIDANQCFRSFAQLILDNEKCKIDTFVEYLLKSFQYSKATLKKRVIDKDFKSFICDYKAPIKIGLLTEENPNLLNYKLDNKYQAVQYLNFLFPWSISASNNIKYLELDCSFCLKPYVFSIITGIIDNESIPLSLTIGPSEKCEIYEIGYKELIEYGANLFDIPILSDMGTAIEKFCETNGIKNHFYCWRHLIESFGSRTFASLIVRRILKITTFNDFESSLIEAFLDLKNLKVNESVMSKFSKFVGYNYDSINNSISKNEYFPDIRKWAIWERFAYTVSTCSNHLEATHRVLKKDSKAFRNLYHKLRMIINRLEIHVKDFPKMHGRSLLKLMKKMNDTVEKTFENIDEEEKQYLLSKYNKNECICNQSVIYSSRYGTYVPCIHMLKNNRSVSPSRLPDNLLEKNLHHVIKIADPISGWEFANRYNISQEDQPNMDKIDDKNGNTPIEISDEPNKYYFLESIKTDLCTIIGRKLYKGEKHTLNTFIYKKSEEQFGDVKFRVKVRKEIWDYFNNHWEKKFK